MDQYEHIRTAHRVYQKSIRQIARENGSHTQNCLRKALQGLPPKYRRKENLACAVMDSVAEVVERWLKAAQEEPRKQRRRRIGFIHDWLKSILLRVAAVRREPRSERLD